MELFVLLLTIFVLAVFVGFEVITKVPPTLHTPLMSGSNAISGITGVGALIAAGGGPTAPRSVFWGSGGGVSQKSGDAHVWRPFL